MTASTERRRFGSGPIGTPLDRVDGPLKVRGAARYSAEYPLEGLAHAVLLQSTIARGRIVALDTTAAEAAPGVLAVLTHLNTDGLPAQESFLRGGATIQTAPLMQDDRIQYAGQHIGIVVAETLEQAQQAARLVRLEYAAEPPLVGVAARLDEAYPAAPFFGETGPDSVRGDPEGALAAAEVRLDRTYRTPIEHHNPIEPPATTAAWDADGNLTVYDANQFVVGIRQGLAAALGIPPERIRVLSRFLGGGFGAKGTFWPHTALAALAARRVQRPVKLVLTRAQMYTSHGYRSETVQQVSLGARRDGALTALRHATTSIGSEVGEFPEMAGSVTQMLYACPNLATSQRLVRTSLGVPGMMRAPGEATGAFALESALDELAYELGIDPIELRIKNHAEVDPESGRPWSSKSLLACYRVGAERFGWARRSPEPGSMRDGPWLVGWGMASATYPAGLRIPAVVRARIEPDGRAVVQCATHDLGTGAATIFTQIAAEALGLPPQLVRFELGDSDLPFSFAAGGSSTTGSAGPSVYKAARAVRDRVLALALDDEASPIHGYTLDDLTVEQGRAVLTHDPSLGEAYAQIIARHGGQPIEVTESDQPGDELQRYAMHTFGAHFAEVRVDADFGIVRVGRVVTAVGAGRIINPKTARSQLVGGVIMGIGMALLEETAIHPALGTTISPNLSGYLVPVHADVPPIDAVFVEEHDPHVNPLGAKGIGEVSTVGVAAAIANAVHHATGVRVRDLPITAEKLV
jgi:xanthine dehydrogenase YagR molybdenum-binding subunit